MARSLRGRLGIALGLVAAISVLASALIAFGLVRRYSEQTAQHDLERLAEATALEARAGRIGRDPSAAPALRRLLRLSGVHLAFVTADGRVRGEGSRLLGSLDTAPLLAGREVRGTVRSAEGDVAFVGFPMDAPLGGGPGPRGFVLGRPLRFAREVWGPIVARLLLAAVAAIAAAVAVSMVLARRLTGPLQDLSEGAGRVAAGDLSHRVPVPGDDEIGRVASSFNAMSSSLAESRRREREFLANVSHELRTPLTSIRGYVEALEEGAVRDEPGRAAALGVIRAEAGRLERLVQDVLDLARLGAGELRLDRHPTDLAGTLREAAAAHAAQAGSSGVRLEVEAPESLPAETDPVRVRQVISNLLDNALRVTPHGGAVRLSGRMEATSLVVEVADSGPGIASEHLPHVFERSYLRRVSGGAPPSGLGSSGLGLAIVRELVEALGGSVSVESALGRGTVFRIALAPRDRS